MFWAKPFLHKLCHTSSYGGAFDFSVMPTSLLVIYTPDSYFKFLFIFAKVKAGKVIVMYLIR